MAVKFRHRIGKSRLILLAAIVTLIPVLVHAQKGRSAVLDWGEFQSVGELPAVFGQTVVFALGKITVPPRGPVRAVLLKGTLDAGLVTGISIARARLTGRHLKFETQGIRGVSYTFSGDFPENFALDTHGDPGDGILQGVLIKLERGKEVARAAISFRFQNYSD